MDMNMAFLLWTILQETQRIGEMNETQGVVEEQPKPPPPHTITPSEDLYISYFKELNKLTLICQAMWTLLKEETNLSERDLMGRITELDLKDGQIDGVYTAPPRKCPNCDAMVSKKFSRCLFCGTESRPESVFDSL